MTRVDLDTVLKLQREYTTLEQRLTRLLEWVVDLNRGVLTAFIKSDDTISEIAEEVLEIANKTANKDE